MEFDTLQSPVTAREILAMVEFLKSGACPSCGNQTDIRTVRSFGNAFRALGNWVIVLLTVLSAGPLGESISLKKKCLNCGSIFCDQGPMPTRTGHCTKCGYNLTGNTTGVCPECGTAM